MIINKLSKFFQIRSDKPNSNWLDNEWYVIPDNSELSEKVVKLYPRFDFVTNEFGELVDVVEIPKTQEEINEERAEEIKNELVILDSTINRATEDLYVLTNTKPYESTQNVINRKIELRNELKTITGGVTNAENNTNE